MREREKEREKRKRNVVIRGIKSGKGKEEI